MIDMPDIDIDFANRLQILKHIPGTPARLDTGARHNTGVYFTAVPVAYDGIATIEHKAAEEIGYFKLDLLNVNVYEHVSNEMHLLELMKEPIWECLTDRNFFEQVIHINNHWDLAQQLPQPIDSIPRMAMFLAIIRPGKRHLAGLSWADIAKTVWIRPEDGSYFFKKSHSVAYAQLVAVHMNILCENITKELPSDD